MREHISYQNFMVLINSFGVIAGGTKKSACISGFDIKKICSYEYSPTILFCIIISVSDHSSTYPVNSLFKNQYLYQSSCTIIKKQRWKLAFLFDFTQFCQYENYHDISKHMAFHMFNACTIHFRRQSLVHRFAFPFFWCVLSPIWNEWWENWQTEVLSEWKVSKRKGYV